MFSKGCVVGVVLGKVFLTVIELEARRACRPSRDDAFARPVDHVLGHKLVESWGSYWVRNFCAGEAINILRLLWSVLRVQPQYHVHVG